MVSETALRQIIANWPLRARAIQFEALTKHAGLSGALLWRVCANGCEYCLRRWPKETLYKRLEQVHTLQHGLGAFPCVCTPRIVPAHDGSTIVRAEGYLWEVASWCSGTEVPVAVVTSEQAASAWRSVAEFHVAAGTLSHRLGVAGVGCALGLRRRAERVAALRTGELRESIGRLDRFRFGATWALILQAAEIVKAELAPMERRLKRGRHGTLPVQWCHGDLRWQNLVFKGDSLSGILDLGAATVDSVVRDVARLRVDAMSMPAMDPAAQLAVYQQIRPLSSQEFEALTRYQETTIPLAIANWIGWLAPHAANANDLDDRQGKAIARLEALVQRYRDLKSSGPPT